MIKVNEFVEFSTDFYKDETGEYPPFIPQWKKDFSKLTRELWEMLEDGEDKTHHDLHEKVNDLSIKLDLLKHNIKDYASHSTEENDWI